MSNIIRKITGRDEVRQRLAELGFVVGEPVTVVSELGGNLILSVKESRVALDKDDGHAHHGLKQEEEKPNEDPEGSQDRRIGHHQKAAWRGPRSSGASWTWA